MHDDEAYSFQMLEGHFAIRTERRCTPGRPPKRLELGRTVICIMARIQVRIIIIGQEEKRVIPECGNQSNFACQSLQTRLLPPMYQYHN